MQMWVWYQVPYKVIKLWKCLHLCPPFVNFSLKHFYQIFLLFPKYWNHISTWGVEENTYEKRRPMSEYISGEVKGVKSQYYSLTPASSIPYLVLERPLIDFYLNSGISVPIKNLMVFTMWLNLTLTEGLPGLYGWRIFPLFIDLWIKQDEMVEKEKNGTSA